ncbi:ATP-binding protein [Agarivorans sp. JK6]|uniref:ATP-binding protein n=1 Tax=Agarivorans sp. JK6 TaxID=2997426 RepID=UPI0038738B3A
MITLFLKLFLSSVLSIIAATFIYGVIIEEKVQHIEREQIRQIVLPIYYLLDRDLLQVENPDVDKVLTRYQEEFPFFIRIFPITELDAEARLKLMRNGEYISVKSNFLDDDDIVLYYQWPDQQVLELDLDEEFVDYGDWLFWYMVALMGGCLAATVMWFSFSITRHTYRLAKVTKALGDGDFDVSANEKAPSPINHMARSLNSMAAKLKSLIQEQDSMTMAASHELKTPINNLRFALDMTRSITDMKTMHEHIQEMDEDLDSLEDLTHELISFSQLTKAREINPQSINPYPLLYNMCERLSKLSPKLKIQIECPVGLSLMADEKLVRRALNNLIVNAQKYAEKLILIRAYVVNKSVIFEVHDDGSGVPEKYRESIFLPFARVDDSRSRQSGGHGLGLSIVERIVTNHCGKASVSDSHLGGALFTLELPLFQNSEDHKE